MKNLPQFLILIGIYVAACFQAHGQELKIGDTFPGYTSNYGLETDKEIFIGNFKKPLNILWFWNYHCQSNIKALRKLEALQKQFNTHVDIDLINIETQADSRAYFKEYKQIKLPPFKTICQGSDLINRFSKNNKLFAVWIDNKGLIKHITEHYNFTKENINAFLKGDTTAIHNWDSGTDAETQLLYNSRLTRSGNTSGSFSSRYDNKDSFYLQMVKTPIATLYRIAYGDRQSKSFKTDAQLIVAPSIAEIVLFPKNLNYYDNWKAKQQYDYTLRLPAEQAANWQPYMQQDLKRYFGYEARVEKRPIDCFVLEKIGKIHPANKSNPPKNGLNYLDYLKDSIACIVNTPFREFSDFLTFYMEYNLQKPFIDNTGIQENIDLCLRSRSLEPLDIEGLNQDLIKYNLKISIRKQAVEVLIIDPKK